MIRCHEQSMNAMPTRRIFAESAERAEAVTFVGLSAAAGSSAP
jgi:hypothetical protein